MECHEPFERNSGIMIDVCQPCLDKPKPPYVEPYIEQRGLLIPNPEASK
jgi:hypothetical protein